jgi:hypothetical protein
VVPPAGFEPTTLSLEVSCSIHLSYGGECDYYTEVSKITYNSGMQKGPYIANRLMPGVIAAYCNRAGIDFQAYSSDWVLRLSRGGVVKWIVGTKFDLNGSAVGELAQDKVATYTVLSAAGIKAVPHYLVRSLPHELIHIDELYDELGEVLVVAKPLEGTGGRDVMLMDSTDKALTMIRASGEPAWALSPHLDLQTEYRLIMLDDKSLLAFEKTKPTYRDNLKLFNLGFGAVAADIDEDVLNQLLPIARNAMQTTALRLASVDIVRTASNELLVLEINDGITMEHYARQSNEYKDRTIRVYETIVNALFE